MSSRSKRSRCRSTAATLAILATLGCRSSAPALEVVLLDDDGDRRFEVRGFDEAQLAALRGEPWSRERLSRLIAVYTGTADADLPPVAGRYRVADDTVVFVPRFGLKAGLQYVAVVDPAELGSRAAPRFERTFRLPPPPPTEPTVVEAVYPSGDVLPENVLRFYLHFSAPMRQGCAYDYAKVLDASGTPIERSFLEIGEELWDPSATRLTLLIQPGRIKRGLIPREEEGPVFEAGKRYSIVIDAGWPDHNGRPLDAAWRKDFVAGEPDTTQPDPSAWRLSTPTATTTEPLVVRFEQPLDHGVLGSMLWVTGEAGPIEGDVEVGSGELSWRFTPNAPWRAGAHHLVVDTELEDQVGNSVRAPFEVDMFVPRSTRRHEQTVELPFTVASGR